MSRLRASVVLAATLACGCSQHSAATQQHFALYHQGSAIGSMEVSCEVSDGLLRCATEVAIDQLPSAANATLTSRLESEHFTPSRRVLRLTRRENNAETLEAARTFALTEEAYLQLDALQLLASSGALWGAVPVVDVLAERVHAVRCVIAPAGPVATAMWCRSPLGTILARTADNGALNWVRSESGVQAVGEGGEPMSTLRATQPHSLQQVSPSVWRAGAYLEGGVSMPAALNVPGRQRWSYGEDGAAIVVHVVAEPGGFGDGACLSRAAIDAVRTRVRETRAGRNTSALSRDGLADCTEDAALALTVLATFGCSARAVFGYAHDAERDGWHAWVEVDEGGRVRTLDPRSGTSPVPAGWIRIGELSTETESSSSLDVMRVRVTYIEADDALARIERGDVSRAAAP